MPRSCPLTEAQPTHPEVVQAAFDALINRDPTKLAPFFGTGMTLAEHRQAQGPVPRRLERQPGAPVPAAAGI